MAYANEQRKAYLKKIEVIVKKESPIDKDMLVSRAMYDLGLTRTLAKDYVMVLANLGIIAYDKDRLLVWRGFPKAKKKFGLFRKVK